MKILRVLNTNAIVTLDEKNQEIIVTGAGIGFKKKRGDLVDKSQIDKVYCLKNDEFNKRLQNIVENISEKYLNITGKVVDAAKKSGIKTNDILYVTLTDHINSAIERYKSDIHLKNILKLDIQKFYSQEYIIGKQAVIWIAKETGIDLGDDEAAFIAMHIVSSELDNSLTSDVQKMTELINSILKYFPNLIVCPCITSIIVVLLSNLCSSNLFLINPAANLGAYIGTFICFKKYGTLPIWSS